MRCYLERFFNVDGVSSHGVNRETSRIQLRGMGGSGIFLGTDLLGVAPARHVLPATACSAHTTGPGATGRIR